MITSRKLTNNPDITSASVFYSSYMNASQVLQILNRRHSTTAGGFFCSFYPNMDLFPPRTSLSFNYSQDS